MAMSMGAKIGAASFVAVVAILVGAGMLAWNRAAAPSQMQGVRGPYTESVAGTGPATQPAGTPLFTLSTKTTAIVDPLHEDGTPDYVAALRDRYGEGITPDMNAFAAWLTVAGTGQEVLSEKIVDSLTAAAGVTPSPTRWVTFFKYCDDHEKSDHGSASPNGIDDINKAERRPWTEADLPFLAVFLRERGALLDAGKVAWSRPRYWIPAVSVDGHVVTILLPSLGLVRDLERSLLARAMLHAGAHDFAGFESDVLAALHIATLLSGGSSIIEPMVGYSMAMEASHTIAACAAADPFSPDEWHIFAAALDHVSPIQDLSKPIDMEERYSLLDLILTCATGRLDTLSAADSKELAPLGTIDANAVEWDVVLRQINNCCDLWVHATQQAHLDDATRESDAIDRQIGHGGSRSGGDLGAVDGESRQDYTGRVGRALLRMLGPSLGIAIRTQHECLMQLAMARALVAAAGEHAVSKRWPASLQELVPANLPAVPVDVYVAGNDTEIHYVLTPDGPAVYSVGRNHRDDQGRRDASGHDDLVLGAPIPSTDAP